MTAFTALPSSSDFLPLDDDQPRGLAAFDLIDSLISQYNARSDQLKQTMQLIKQAEASGVMRYFITGAQLRHDDSVRFTLPTDLEAADAVLRAEYWTAVLARTDVFDSMPVKMRLEARNEFSGLNCPPFDETTVRPTLEGLLSKRSEFLAMRVDGIFTGLSGDHITNQPGGFSLKMILNNVFDKYGYCSTYKSGLISDLRSVISLLMGRGEHSSYATSKLLTRAYGSKTGKKVAIDGGALTITVYKVGTVHVTVNQDIAVALNEILASLYPLAIPASFRTPRKSSAATYEIQRNILPAHVLDVLTTMERRGSGYSINKGISSVESSAAKQALELLEDIGGTVTTYSSTHIVAFDYDVAPVIESIIFSGTVADNASTQFYPTRSQIADEAIERLEVEEGMTCLEPQAGTGDLAAYLPKATTTCVELVKLRAKVLEQKGFQTITADFLSWADMNAALRFDRIVMNPPFSKGRALLHLKAASSLLADDGRLVAILPASMINTAPLQGFQHEWSQVFVDAFEGTSVRVAILTATKAD